MHNAEKIFEMYYDTVKLYVNKHINNRADAEDITQEIFYKFFLGIDRLKSKTNVKNWIYTIAKNTIIDYYRKNNLEIISEKVEEPEESQISHSESKIPCLNEIVQLLPIHYQKAILLVDIQGYTQKELADLLGLSLPGAKSRVQRARKKLKEKLFECCRFEFDNYGNIIDYQHKNNKCDYCSYKNSAS